MPQSPPSGGLFYEEIMNLAYDYIEKSKTSELVLFIHGLGASRKSFGTLIDSGSLSGYHILNIDLIGFGEASKPEDFDYELISQANRVSELLMQNLRFNRLHVVAHSMGGAVGLLLDQRVLHKIGSFSNLEGNLISEDCDMFSRRVLKFSPEKYASALFPRQKRAFDGHPVFDFENTTPIAVYKSSESLVRWSESGELLSSFLDLKCRKAYFYGEENRAMPILQKLKNTALIEIPSAGHCMMSDNPAEFSRKLIDFINQ